MRRLAKCAKVTTHKKSYGKKESNAPNSISGVDMQIEGHLRKGKEPLNDAIGVAVKKESNAPTSISRVDVWIEGHLRKDKEPLNDAIGVAVKKMKDYTQTQPKGTSSLQDDGVTHVFGVERRGRVRGLGFGATISKIQGIGYQREQAKRMEEMMNEIKVEIMNEMKEMKAEMMNEMKAELMDEMKALLSNATPNLIPTNLQGFLCELLHFNGSGVVVAKAEIASTDPNALSDECVPVGPDCWKVWINDVIDKDCPLYRANKSGMFYLCDARTSTVIWPTKYVKILEDLFSPVH
ncbi:uncharacterized protein LOC132306493 isoform X2 [Cornus florida]|uniref:uncharacterized protein LOC132306493 isoform X2 n=1 Tax=Cornus florida TaxID=4283 RepID=UPI0028A08F62|nr:uncharacterized protein LOC132306493 isoform X2 [Cornus florida]